MIGGQGFSYAFHSSIQPENDTSKINISVSNTATKVLCKMDTQLDSIEIKLCLHQIIEPKQITN